MKEPRDSGALRWSSVVAAAVVLAVLVSSSGRVGAESHAYCEYHPFNTFAYCNYTLPFDVRIQDFISRLTLDEKISLMGTTGAAVSSVGMPAYSWWSEALHGVVSVNYASTSFPEPIGLGATFNTSLYHSIGSVISTEARALNNVNASFWVGPVGLTFFTPNINIFRDPRWGRGQETPGEDPYWTSQYVQHLVKGLQEGDDPRYLKVLSTCKHFDAYSLENWDGITRYEFDAIVSLSDLVDTYLPAFEACVQLGGARSIMCSYNAVNGVPSCANDFLLKTMAREQWNFTGYVVGDCGAVSNIQSPHNYTNTTQATCGVAMGAGTDLDCGTYYQSNLAGAVASGDVTEDQIDTAVGRLIEQLMSLGFFDPPELVTYQKIGLNEVNTPYNQQLALEAAQQSIVLLKNENDMLPIQLDSINTVAIIGPNANASNTYLGNYFGTPPYIISPLMAFQALDQLTVLYEQGASILGNDTSGFDNAVTIADKADLVVLFVGLNQSVESEGNDRYTLDLPGVQLQLVQKVFAVGKPTIVVYVNGGPVGDPWIQQNIPAILESWYGGQSAGQAIVDVIFGTVNPSGRLPVSIYYNNYTQEIAMTNMNMQPYPGRTYRYLQVPTLWEFGFGLSYSTWNVTWVSNVAEVQMFEQIDFSAIIQNTGSVAFFTPPEVENAPLQQLFGAQKVYLEPGQSTQVYFTLPPVAMAIADNSGKEWLHPGIFKIKIDNYLTQFKLVGDQPTLLPDHLRIPLGSF